MRFQERMANTAHQREVTDLRAAGLNPILSANKGAASPGGAMPQIQDAVTPAVNSALAAARQVADIKLIQEQTRKAGIEADAMGARGVLGRNVRDIALGLEAAIKSGNREVVQAMTRILESVVTPLGATSAKGLESLLDEAKKLISQGGNITPEDKKKPLTIDIGRPKHW